MTERPRRVAAITGAACGIGRATVELFAERGYAVVAVDADAVRLAALTRLGSGIATVIGDVAEAETSDAMAAVLAERFGRLDALVLNAGIGGSLPFSDPGSIDRLDRILEVNVRGVALGLRAALPLLGPGSAVVVTSSLAGLRADPGTWAYNASKAAAINLARAAALDLAPRGIRVNAVAPGLTRTTLTNPTGSAQGADRLDTLAAARIPLGRLAEPSEQAEVIWFLASPAASYVTGAVLACDGGVSASTGLLSPARGDQA